MKDLIETIPRYHHRKTFQLPGNVSKRIEYNSKDTTKFLVYSHNVGQSIQF